MADSRPNVLKLRIARRCQSPVPPAPPLEAMVASGFWQSHQASALSSPRAGRPGRATTGWELRRCAAMVRPMLARGPFMTDRIVPHFHNDLGVGVIEIGAREFMCV